MRNASNSFQRGRRQQGYMLLAIMLMAALILIGLSVELPAISRQIRHDREEELIHRGAQYARAIKRYYKKFGNYPVSIEQLESTNNVRYLRKRYKDPITGEDFRLLHPGDVQLTLGSSSGTSSTSATNPGTPISGAQSGSPDSQARTQPNSTFGQSSTQSGSSSSVLSSAGSKSSGSFGSSNQQFGGGPIIGVASTSEKQSMHVFNQKDHYKDWAFIYDPTFIRAQGLITGPYNGIQTFGGGQIQGAVSPNQMNQGQNQPGTPSPDVSGQQTFGQPRQQ